MLEDGRAVVIGAAHDIRTPDQRLRVFVSSTLGELAEERASVRRAIEDLHLTPVLFELGARPHPPRALYRAYLEQSDVFIGVYGERYGWVAPGQDVSGLEDEYRLASGHPKLLYVKADAPDREDRLERLLADVRDDDEVSYKRYRSPEELGRLVVDDLALLLSERFAGPSTGEGGAASTPSALPIPPTPTFGRSGDVALVLRLLADGARCVTLSGPGGVGKTRLALEVARACARRRPEVPVHLVALAAVQDPELALRRILDEVGARVEGSRPLEQALVEHVGDAEVLLLLDNLEQVLGVAPHLGAVLARCPGLVLLVTSRQPLGIRAEQEVVVEPLPVVGGGPSSPRGPAVELFLDRAAAADLRFAPDAGDLVAIEALCRRLDGLPLAIELAAARVRLLTPAAMLERLDAGRELPSAPAGDRPSRQQTLRATLEWSHDLLTADEAEVFAAFGAFAGGAEVGAAELVCAPTDGDDALDLLLSLVDKSLLRIEAGPDGTPRLSMLETVRSFAAEQLDAGGQGPEVRLRHRECYRILAWEAHPYLCGPGQREWVRRLDHERSDLLRAVETSFDRGDVEVVVDLAWAVYVYFWLRDAEDEPGAWLERAAAECDGLDRLALAKLRSLVALNRNSRGEFHRTEQDLLAALEVFREEQHEFMAAVTLKELGTVWYVLDEGPGRAAAALDEASARFDSVGHAWGVALVETMLGTMRAVSGDLERAERHHLRSLERSRAIDSDQLVVQGLHQLAMVRVLEGEVDEAIDLVAEAAGIVVREGFQVPATTCLDVLGAAAVRRGEVAVGVDALLTASAVRGRLGTAPWPTVSRFVDRMTEESVELLHDPPDPLDRSGRDAVLELRRLLERLLPADGAPSSP